MVISLSARIFLGRRTSPKKSIGGERMLSLKGKRSHLQIMDDRFRSTFGVGNPGKGSCPCVILN